MADRKIRFRARRKSDGKWVEGNYFHNFRKGESHSITEFTDNTSHLVYRESLQLEDAEFKFRNI
jgi:hypothetical protein